MTKKIFNVLLVCNLVMLIVVGVLLAVNLMQRSDPSVPSEVEILQIEIAWRTKFDEELNWDYVYHNVYPKVRYYGTYDNCIVFCDTEDPPIAGLLRQKEYGGRIFEFHTDFEIYVFCDGVIITLQEAIDNGMIDSKELQRIYGYHIGTPAIP